MNKHNAFIIQAQGSDQQLSTTPLAEHGRACPTCAAAAASGCILLAHLCDTGYKQALAALGEVAS